MSLIRIGTLGLLSYACLFGSGKSFCDYGLIGFFPVATDTCNLHYAFGSNGSFSSYGSSIIKCANDGMSATLYEFENSFFCSGGSTNMTELAYFDCNTTGYCNSNSDTIDLTFYNFNVNDCFNGTIESISGFTLAEIEGDYCTNYGGVGFAVTFYDENYGVTVDAYANASTCSGYWYGTVVQYPNYDCDNSTLFFYNINDDSNISETTTMTPNNNGTDYFIGICNYGIDPDTLFPIAAGQCTRCSGDYCGNIQSKYIDCYSSDYAILYNFNTSYCSGLVNMTYLDYFYCDASDCNDTDYIVEMVLGINEDDDCGGEVVTEIIYSLPMYVFACINFGSISVEIYFYEEDLYIYSYNGNDCSGTYLGGVIYNDNDCINGTEIEYINSNGNDTNEIYGDCNYGLFGFFPVAEGYCHTCSGDCDGIESLEMVCSGDYGILYMYDDTGCSGNVVNMTYLDYYYCDADTCGSGEVVDMGSMQYEDIDCDGDIEGNTTITLPMYAEACIDFFLFYVYIDMYGYNLEVGFYGDSGCDSDYYGSRYYYDGLCDNKTSYSFSLHLGDNATTTTGEPMSTMSTMTTTEMGTTSNMTMMSTDLSDDNSSTDSANELFDDATALILCLIASFGILFWE